ncbi:disintegrin and metalloproteinase domain-containing protein 25-like [Ochotona curzoniae]|uniref:disintegrin and metalloproteinase domain-containing protein 25-like n=1 Tax=Ochotona curzoniae TaxID=130825 RepID=UPI001B346D89|nr:disintegrin and metalloproteinase domain-containing protein 25-like [Ochotona curzoniae]
MRVTGTRKGVKTPGWLSYSLHFGGQRHIIHMKAKKLLVSTYFPVFTYTDQGALVGDEPYVQDDCHFQGHVEGDPESIIALSSCFGGLQGMLKITDAVYEIKPKRFSTKHEHLIYKLNYNETEFPSMKCGLTEQTARQLAFQETNNFPLRQISYEGWWTHRWFVELAVVVDHQRFLHRESNASGVLVEVSLILNEINAFYSAMDVDFSLSGLEIWNEGNQLQENDMEQFLITFCQWKRVAINHRIPHDILHLFIKQNFGKYVGLAYVGTICHQNYNCGINKFDVDELFPLAHTVAHEIGHNLGMAHDDHTCTCGKSTCIMSPAENDSNSFSNCSYASFYEILLRTFCMHNLPYLLKTDRQCGNGVVEEGEECDCGSLQMCTHDPCCLTNCTLRPGAACAFGLCCKDCQLRASGEVCREKDNECDLPEWCNGVSQACPDDVYMENGYKCLDTGFCYKKRCNVRDEQCRQIFGKKAKNANLKCYREINSRGNRFGNCGNESGSYIGCNIKDILCGRIQCQNVTSIPYLKEHSTVHFIHISGHDCWGTDHHFGMPISDIGDVKDGTECGEKHMCIHRSCVSVERATHLCSLKRCHKNGVCNNKHHCHCNSNWAPPRCEREGSGGSIDSGPPPHRKLKKSTVQSYVTLFLLSPFLLLCCYFIISLCRRKIKEEKRKEAPLVGKQSAEAPPESGQDAAAPLSGEGTEAPPKEEEDVEMAPDMEQNDQNPPEMEEEKNHN